jgi:hypothetical protein
MNFFENRARKAELHARATVFEALTELGGGATWGGVALPCHIISEKHNGIFIQAGETVLVTFGCQGVWWGYNITPKLLGELNGPYGEALVFPMFGTLMSPENLLPFPGRGARMAAAAFVYAVQNVEEERKAALDE